MTDPETVARGLTKAQRRMIERVGDSRCFERYCDMRTLHALDARKLTSGYQERDTFEMIVTLTPLGLRVRALLEKERVG